MNHTVAALAFVCVAAPLACAAQVDYTQLVPAYVDIGVQQETGIYWDLPYLRDEQANLRLDLSNGSGDPARIAPTAKPAGLVGWLNQAQAKVALGPYADQELVLSSRDTTYGARVKTTVRGQISMEIASTATPSWETRIFPRRDPSSGALSLLSSQLAGVEISAGPGDGLSGGTLTWRGLGVNPLAHEITASLEATPLGAATTELGMLPLFTFSDVVGVSNLSRDAIRQAVVNADLSGLQAQGWAAQISPTEERIDLQGKAELRGLKLTAAGRTAFMSALGVAEGSSLSQSLDAINQQAEGFGTLTFSLNMSVTGPNYGRDVRAFTDPSQWPWVRGVPEPGTWALMGLGLVGLAVVRARRTGGLERDASDLLASETKSEWSGSCC
jgi:hypothetical protein